MSRLIYLGLHQGSPEWHEFRRRGGPGNTHKCALGSSDLPIIMGLNKHHSTDDLWAHKLGMKNMDVSNWATDRGHSAEPRIRRWYENETGSTATPLVIYNDDQPWRFCSVDGYNPIGNVGLEAKWTGAENFEFVLSGMVPAEWFPQIQWTIDVANLSCVHLAVENAGRFTMLPVFRDDDYISSRLLPAAEWFIDCVDSGSRPSGALLIAPEAVPTPPAVDGPRAPSPVEIEEFTPADIIDAGPPQLSSAIVPIHRVSDVETVVVLVEDWVETRDELIAASSRWKSIASRADADVVAEYLNTHTSVRRAVEKAAKDAREPFRREADKISDAEKQFIRPLVESEKRLKEILSAWQVAEAVREREEQDRVAKAIASSREASEAVGSGGVSIETVAAASVPAAESAAGTRTSFRLVAEVVDTAKVPREFLVPDIARIQEATDALNPKLFKAEPSPHPTIAGISVRLVADVSSTGKRRKK